MALLLLASKSAQKLLITEGLALVTIWDAWAPVRLIRPQPSSAHSFTIGVHFAQSKT